MTTARVLKMRFLTIYGFTLHDCTNVDVSWDLYLDVASRTSPGSCSRGALYR